MFPSLPRDPVLEDVVLDEQLSALQRAEREAAWAFVGQCEAMQEVWDSAPPDSRMGRRPHAVAEAAAALHLSPQSVESRLAVAETLQDHPVLRSLLLTGRLGIAHLLVVDADMRVLTDHVLAGRVLQDVLVSGGRLGFPGTPSELRRALARAAVRLDPAGAERRRLEQARLRTGVRLQAQPDGLATWVATGDGMALTAADRMLDALSRPAAPDDPRTRGQRQLDALLGALVAQTGGVPLELQLEIPVEVTCTRPVPGAAPEPGLIAVDLTPELLALMTADEAADEVSTDGAGADEPAENQPAAAEPAPGELADESAAGEPAGPAESAEVLADEPAADQAPGAQSQHRPVRRDGVAELAGHGPVGPAQVVKVLADPDGLPLGLNGVRIRRSCVDHTGQVVAVDTRTVALGALLAAGSPSELLARLIAALPAPPPMVATHDPTQRRPVWSAPATTCAPSPAAAGAPAGASSTTAPAIPTAPRARPTSSRSVRTIITSSTTAGPAGATSTAARTGSARAASASPSRVSDRRARRRPRSGVTSAAVGPRRTGAAVGGPAL